MASRSEQGWISHRSLFNSRQFVGTPSITVQPPAAGILQKLDSRRHSSKGVSPTVVEPMPQTATTGLPR